MNGYQIKGEVEGMTIQSNLATFFKLAYINIEHRIVRDLGYSYIEAEDAIRKMILLIDGKPADIKNAMNYLLGYELD